MEPSPKEQSIIFISSTTYTKSIMITKEIQITYVKNSYLYIKSSINYKLRLEIDPLFKMDKVLSLCSGDYYVWNSWLFAKLPTIIRMAEWSRWLSHGNMTVRVRILAVSEFFFSFFLNLSFYRSFFLSFLICLSIV